jgi:hypothetical protein
MPLSNADHARQRFAHTTPRMVTTALPAYETK